MASRVSRSQSRETLVRGDVQLCDAKGVSSLNITDTFHTTDDICCFVLRLRLFFQNKLMTAITSCRVSVYEPACDLKQKADDSLMPQTITQTVQLGLLSRDANENKTLILCL